MERVFPIKETFFLGQRTPVLVKTPGSGGTNHNQTPETVRQTVEGWNKPGRMQHNWTESRQSTLLTRTLAHLDGKQTTVALNKPINPYTEGAHIVSAHLPQHKYEATDTAVFSYDLPFSTQVAYLETAFAALLTKDNMPLPEEISLLPLVGRMRAANRRRKGVKTYSFIMENDAPLSFIDRRFTESGKIPQRTSRTGGPTHLHVARVSERSFAGQSPDVPIVAKEQQFVREFQQTNEAHKFLSVVEHHITRASKDPVEQSRIRDHVHLSMESGKPVGYSMKFDDITRENILQQVPYIAQILLKNFEGYTKGMALLARDVREAFERGETIHPSLTQELFTSMIAQPAFRRYMRFEKDEQTGKENFVVYIAPQVIAHTGPMEPAGLNLYRGPEVPRRTTKIQDTLYSRRVRREVDRLTKGRKQELQEVRRRKRFTGEELP